METILKMSHICKQFPGVLANDDVCLEVKKGEVHTLLGENGAGKSTLMNILCGLYRPTSGEVYLEGKQVSFHSAKDAMNQGIGMVHQHFMLIPTLTVAENCLIGAKSDNPMYLDLKAASKQIRELSEHFRMQVNPDALVGDLSVGECQRAEIIKALYRGAKILILDEPTAVLTPQETNELFHMIRTLTADGYTVIFISHKLNEVCEISDSISILRQGKCVGTLDKEIPSITELARLMVGRDVDMSVQRAETDQSEVVLSVEEITLDRDKNTKILNDVSFDVHAGEVFGIAGVDGNGQSELVECLTGLKKATSGKAMYKDKNLLERSTREIMADEVSHVPQDRQGTGLVLTMDLTENMILQDYYKEEFGKKAFLDWAYINEYTDQLIQDYQVKTPSRFELAQNLSGGNQQKVIIAREINRKPKLLIAMHPTRGVDVGAIEYIHKRIMQERDQGRAILLVSTELDEVLKLSDRVAVMYEGEVMGIVRPQDVSIEEMGLMMGGTKYENVKDVLEHGCKCADVVETPAEETPVIETPAEETPVIETSAEETSEQETK